MNGPERTENMSEDFNAKVNEFVEKAGKTIEEGSKNLLSKLDYEKRKAEIRSEIGHASRDLTKAYERLGREFYEAKVNNREFTDSCNTFELIRTKEKVLELLHERLTRVENENQ